MLHSLKCKFGSFYYKTERLITIKCHNVMRYYFARILKKLHHLWNPLLSFSIMLFALRLQLLCLNWAWNNYFVSTAKFFSMYCLRDVWATVLKIRSHFKLYIWIKLLMWPESRRNNCITWKIIGKISNEISSTKGWKTTVLSLLCTHL